MNCNQLSHNQHHGRTPKLLIQTWIDIIDNKDMDRENTKENAINLLTDLFGSINEARVYLENLNKMT